MTALMSLIRSPNIGPSFFAKSLRVIPTAFEKSHVAHTPQDIEVLGAAKIDNPNVAMVMSKTATTDAPNLSVIHSLTFSRLVQLSLLYGSDPHIFQCNDPLI